jgi:hypothetical protein
VAQLLGLDEAALVLVKDLRARARACEYVCARVCRGGGRGASWWCAATRGAKERRPRARSMGCVCFRTRRRHTHRTAQRARPAAARRTPHTAPCATTHAHLPRVADVLLRVVAADVAAHDAYKLCSGRCVCRGQPSPRAHAHAGHSGTSGTRQSGGVAPPPASAVCPTRRCGCQAHKLTADMLPPPATSAGCSCGCDRARGSARKTTTNRHAPSRRRFAAPAGGGCCCGACWPPCTCPSHAPCQQFPVPCPPLLTHPGS